MRIVALDLGAKKISFCELRDGVVLARRTVPTFESLKDVLGADSPPARVAIEACREAWAIHDRLRETGHEPVLVDTTRVKEIGIGQHGRKTDRIDAEVLARALEANRIPRAHVPVASTARGSGRSWRVRRGVSSRARTQYITDGSGSGSCGGQEAGGVRRRDFRDAFSRSQARR